jgi:hypothetical protein
MSGSFSRNSKKGVLFKVQQEHSFPARPTFFVAKDSFLQDEPWEAVGPPSLSLWVVVYLTG